MMRAVAVTLPILAIACSKGNAPKLDGGSVIDARIPTDADDDVDAPTTTDGSTEPYRHTIVVDGVDDFTAGESFPTTSAAYAAKVTWDDTNIYVGYSGPDLDPAALDSSTKWLFVYLDVDPAAESGSRSSQQYNTQIANFPSGFGAEFYARWKCDGTYSSIEQHDGGIMWSTVAGTTLGAARAGTFLELAIPRALVGTASKVGVVTWMINEKPNFEGTFAGLYATNFADGYGMGLPITKYLLVDFASPSAPNDAANARP